MQPLLTRCMWWCIGTTDGNSAPAALPYCRCSCPQISQISHPLHRLGSWSNAARVMACTGSSSHSHRTPATAAAPPPSLANAARPIVPSAGAHTYRSGTDAYSSSEAGEIATTAQGQASQTSVEAPAGGSTRCAPSTSERAHDSSQVQQLNQHTVPSETSKRESSMRPQPQASAASRQAEARSDSRLPREPFQAAPTALPVARGDRCTAPGVQLSDANSIRGLTMQIKQMKSQMITYASLLDNPEWKQQQADGGKAVSDRSTNRHLHCPLASCRKGWAFVA